MEFLGSNSIARGGWQGDPISPLYLLFGSDLLQSVVNDLVHEGKLK
jgi:hypothetical protein